MYKSTENKAKKSELKVPRTNSDYGICRQKDGIRTNLFENSLGTMYSKSSSFSISFYACVGFLYVLSVCNSSRISRYLEDGFVNYCFQVKLGI